MLDNPTLFHALGLSWTVAKCFGAAAVVLLLLNVLLFVILFKHTHGKAQRLSPEEAGRVALYPVPGNDVLPIQSEGVGVGVELSFNIDTLRKAARRGDWLEFWGFPAGMACGVGAFWCFFMVPAVLTHSRLFAIIASVSCGPLLFLLSIFMPWAAIYTNIDADP